MRKYIVTYLGAIAAFAAVDAVWLTQVGPNLYRPTLDPVLADQPDLVTAVVFYLAYILGTVVLVVVPARSLGHAARTGAILGAMCYATYDLTNQATLKVWSLHITLIDISWGTFLTATTAAVGYLVLSRFTPK